MELAAYEGGAGGKFRRRPTRRPAATPYDRPLSAVRGLRGIATANGGGGGWLSKLVDPASRFISGSASKLFSSVFRKRLTAPPVVQEQNSQVILDVPEAVDSAPIELHSQEVVDGQNLIKNVDDTHGISEIEQLLKQKTYTRAQVDYLTELIRIRTIEPPRPESESNNEKVHISHKGNGIRSSCLNKHLSTPAADLSIPQDVVASPAEIAKAYMSSRPPTAGYSAISLRSPIFTEDQSLPSSVPFSSKSPGLSATSQSVFRSSDAREFSGTRYDTPRPRGRSAIYRMSRSPYFMADPSVNRKENDYTTGSLAGPTSSQWTPGSTSKSDVKQVFKRGRSVLDSDYGSFGPIRRIRQKSGLISAAKESLISPSSSPHGFKGPATQKPSSLNEIKFESTALQIAANGDNNLFSSKVPLVSEQSSEFGRKILEQLDKFVPSPRGKSHAKPVARDESPSKLTTDMLNGRALRSMENVDASQFISMDENGNSEFSNEKVLQNLRAFESEKLLKAEENGFSKPGVPGAKFAAAANGVSKPVLSNKNPRHNISSADTTISAPALFLSQRKPAFQMTAPEDSLEVDDEHDAVDTFVQSTSSMAKAESKIANLKASISSILTPEKPLLTSAKSMGASSSISFLEASKKAYDASYISGKDSSYKFPVAIESGEHSLPAITPTMPTTFQDKLAAQSEQKVGPAFIFGSRTIDTPVPSIVSSESGPELICPDRKIQFDGSNMGRSVRSDAVGLHKSPGIVGSSSLSTTTNTDTAAFSSLISSPRINGSVPSSSISSFVSASTPEAIPRSPVSSFFSNSASTTSSSSSTSPPFSSTTIFNFGAGASIAAPVSVSPLQDQSNLLDSEGKIASNSPFGSSSSTAHGALAFLNTGSSSTSLMGSSPLSGSGNAYSVVTMPTSTPSIATSSAPATPYSFSGVSSSGSDFTSSPSLSSKSNGIFGFSTSVQATSPIISATSSSSQNSNIGVGGSIIVAQPAQSGSGIPLFSQSSTSQLCSLSSSTTPGLSSSSSSMFGSSSPSTFGINSSSSPGFSYASFSTTNQSANPFSSSGFNFSSGNSSSSNSGFAFSSGTGVSGPSSGFSFSSIAGGSNSSSGLSSTVPSTSNSGFSFPASAAGSQTPASSISSPAATSGLFGSSSLGSTSSNSGSVFGSSPSTGFTFGLTAPASGVTSFGIGSSPGSAFSFASADSTMLAGTATPVFGMQSPAGGLSSISQNNDQMSVEDTMADDMNQAPAPMVSTFGQSNSAPASSNFVFGSAVPPGGSSVFQFGSNQNLNPFQAGGNLEFVPGGSFSLGSGGGEKSTRKIVKVRRDKIRRK